MEKTLIISPHADDCLLGAYSFMKKGNILVCSIDEGVCPEDRKHRLKIDEKVIETSKSIGEFSFIKDTYVNELYLEKYWLVRHIEAAINKDKPDVILIPHPSYNQDHQVVFDSCMIALRPHDTNHFVPKVIVYNPYDYTNWGRQMNMNYFREVDINKKLAAYKKMRSQVRPYRSPEDLKRWAECVGKMCKVKYAEGFKVIRWLHQ